MMLAGCCRPPRGEAKARQLAGGGRHQGGRRRVLRVPRARQPPRQEAVLVTRRKYHILPMPYNCNDLV